MSTNTTIISLLVLSLLPACKIVVQAPDLEDEEETTAVSFGSWPAPADASSTGDEPEDETTGGPDESSTSREIGSTSSTDDDSSTGDASTSSTTGDDDMSSSGSDSTTGDTTVAPGVNKVFGETCNGDAECESGTCVESKLEDLKRCSTACTLDAADDCLSQGHPGLCLSTGEDQHHCVGDFSSFKTYFAIATPPPPFGQWSTSGLLSDETFSRHVFLVPASATPFFVKSLSIDFGQVAVDILASDGTLVETFEMDVDHFQIAPQGADDFHWLLLRAIGGKSHYGLWLQSLCRRRTLRC